MWEAPSPYDDFAEDETWPAEPYTLGGNEAGFPKTALPTPVAYLTLVLFIGVFAFVGLTCRAIWHYAPAFAAAAPVATARSTTPPPPQHPSGHIAPLFTPEVHHWEADIVRWAEAFHLDPNLVATVMQIESCGDPQAVSSAGARGLFQVMPFHFAMGEDPFDPNTNARRGLAYLSQALQRSGGDVRLALAGYNGGLGVIGLAEGFWPAETRRYTAWGAPIYRDAAGGQTTSPTLNQWLQSGGWALCRRAHQRLGMP